MAAQSSSESTCCWDMPRLCERECGRLGVQVFWVESICDRDSVIDDNIYKVKVSSVTATLPPSWNCLHADRTLLF